MLARRTCSTAARRFDLDGDGAAEVLIGAGLNRLSAQIGPGGMLDGHGSGGGDGPDNFCDPTGLQCEIGEAYIVWGQRGERPATIELTSPPPSTTIIYGIDRGDAYGEELFAGDFNGDGWGDVAIGAITADGPNNSRPSAGERDFLRRRTPLGDRRRYDHAGRRRRRWSRRAGRRLPGRSAVGTRGGR